MLKQSMLQLEIGLEFHLLTFVLAVTVMISVKMHVKILMH